MFFISSKKLFSILNVWSELYGHEEKRLVKKAYIQNLCRHKLGKEESQKIYCFKSQEVKTIRT